MGKASMFAVQCQRCRASNRPSSIVHRKFLPLLLLAALLSAPLAVPATVCQMPGQAHLKKMTCHGCCGAMKCCAVRTQDKSQPAQSPCHARNACQFGSATAPVL